MIGDHQGRRRLTPTFTIWRNRLRAFKGGDRSIDDLLHKPDLEKADYVPLYWREDIVDKEILPVSLHRLPAHPTSQFSYNWHLHAGRCLCILGWGPGGVLQNFVVSHTIDIFESNYQTQRVRKVKHFSTRLERGWDCVEVEELAAYDDEQQQQQEEEKEEEEEWTASRSRV
ncbi:hypothetical protein ACHAPV_005262 [Trichoderma viride]